MRRALWPIAALVLVLAVLPLSSTLCLLRCEQAAHRDLADGASPPLGAMPCGRPYRCGGDHHPIRATLDHAPAPVGHLQMLAWLHVLPAPLLHAFALDRLPLHVVGSVEMFADPPPGSHRTPLRI